MTRPRSSHPGTTTACSRVRARRRHHRPRRPSLHPPRRPPRPRRLQGRGAPRPRTGRFRGSGVADATAGPIEATDGSRTGDAATSPAGGGAAAAAAPSARPGRRRDPRDRRPGHGRIDAGPAWSIVLSAAMLLVGLALFAIRWVARRSRDDLSTGPRPGPRGYTGTSITHVPRSGPPRGLPMDRLMLLDGNGLIYRGYFALIEQPLTTSKGELVSAVFGFTNIVLRAFQDVGPDHVAVAFDLPDADLPPRALRRVQGHPHADAGRDARADPEGPSRRGGARDPGVRDGGLRGRRRHRHARRPGRGRRPRRRRS